MPELDTFDVLGRDQRLSDRVAERVLESIVGRGLRVGDPLPTERELGQQFGVSRTVVREAVRSLVGKGVVDARPGRGLRVAAPDTTAAMQAMTLYLRGQLNDGYQQVSEVRRIMEVAVAGLAAERATEAEVAELDALCDRMGAASDDTEAMSQADLEFHRALARSTHNALSLVMLDAIGESLIEVRRSTYNALHRGDAAVAAHREIQRRVRARDVGGAMAAMKDHLDDVERELEAVASTRP